MLLAVDWSGDQGVKPGSLPRCVMAVVACKDAVALEVALAEVREKRGLKRDFEFHYTDIDDPILRGEFMQAVAGKFRAAVAVYDKEQMRHRWAWGRDTDLLVQLIIHCILALPPDVIQDGKMVIDGDREVKALKRALRPALSKTLKERGVSERLNKIAPGNSKVYGVIQVADMVCGAINEAAKRQIKVGGFLDAARDSVTVLRITPNMEKPAK